MPTTPDRFPGDREEDQLTLSEDTVDPTEAGALRYVSGSFRFRDGAGVFDPRAGSGITENGHRLLNQLTHWVVESGYIRRTKVSGKTSTVIAYSDAGLTKKIREMEITSRTGAGKVNAIVLKQYDDAVSPVVVETLTITILRDGNGQYTGHDQVLS